MSDALIVEVPEEDLEWLTPGMPGVDAARTLLAQSPRAVLLTRGGEGAVVVMDGRAETVSAPTVTAVDTIGAGDAFSGGWLTWWSERRLGRAELTADVE